jgi:multidrug efflux system membrane fusion protein
MNGRSFHVWLSCSVLALACGQGRTADGPDALEVPVARPMVRELTDYQDFNGRTEAVESVELRARVSGYITRVLFKDGAEVKRGDALFEIDPRPYQAELEKAQALLAAAEARLKRVEGDAKRARALLDSKVVGPQELEKIAAEREEAVAGVRVARAGLELARLNLDFTRVISPIDGRIGRRLLDPGNLVKADETALARVVSEDPMYTYFDMDERALLQIRGAVSGGRLKQPLDRAVPALVQLAGEEGYPHRGAIDFVNNQVNPATGAISVRAVLPNPRLAGGMRLLSPGMFARIRLATSDPHRALLVPDRAVQLEPGKKYVFVVDAEGKVQRRRVTAGQLQDGGLRVIDEGLKPEDRVAVGGFDRLRPGLTVRPKDVAVPEEKPGKEPPSDDGKRRP